HVVRRARLGELLERDRLVAVRLAAPPVLLRPRQAREAGVEQLAAPCPAGLCREVLREPRANPFAEGGLVRAVVQIHHTESRARSPSGSRLPIRGRATPAELPRARSADSPCPRGRAFPRAPTARAAGNPRQADGRRRETSGR